MEEEGGAGEERYLSSRGEVVRGQRGGEVGRDREVVKKKTVKE